MSLDWAFFCGFTLGGGGGKNFSGLSFFPGYASYGLAGKSLFLRGKARHQFHPHSTTVIKIEK
jgi:hypothetical protein